MPHRSTSVVYLRKNSSASGVDRSTALVGFSIAELLLKSWEKIPKSQTEGAQELKSLVPYTRVLRFFWSRVSQTSKQLFLTAASRTHPTSFSFSDHSSHLIYTRTSCVNNSNPSDTVYVIVQKLKYFWPLDCRSRSGTPHVTNYTYFATQCNL